MTNVSTSPVVTSLPETDWHAFYLHANGLEEKALPVHSWDVRADGTRTAYVMDENVGLVPVADNCNWDFRYFISAEDVKRLEELPEVVMTANPAYGF